MTVAELRARAPYVNFIKTKMGGLKKFFYAGISLALAALLSSCLSANFLFEDYSVPITEPYETVKARAEKIVAEKSYIKKFNTEDKEGKKHTVIFLDRRYLSIDGAIMAYRFHNIMYYGPSLSLLKKNVYELPDKMIGMQGYATAAANPQLTVCFIFARKLFGQKGYSSMYEACKINGVSFSSPRGEAGYIDDFGQWRKYSYFDHFESVFKTRRQDVKTEMYQALQVRN